MEFTSRVAVFDAVVITWLLTVFLIVIGEFLLLLSLKFPTVRSFERVAALLNVTLASLYPLTAHELYDTLNANAVLNALVRDDDFTQRMTSLREILWQRRDGTFVFFHPSFRDWLLRREDGEKFVCDLR